MTSREIKQAIIIGETKSKFICKCLNCGKTISDYKSNRNGEPPKYCSQKCYHDDTRIVNTRKCEYCGREFVVPFARSNKRFCNVRCSSAYRVEKVERKGWISDKGYRYFEINRRTVPEHVYVMEKHIGRRLRKDEVVHHKDFNRLNNDISNLQLMTRGEHSSLHRKIEIETNGKISGCHGGWNKKAVRCLDDGIVYESAAACASAYGLYGHYVSRVCKGERKSYKGKHFEYVGES